MRIQAITAAMVLAVVIVGIALAQQTGQRSKNTESGRASERPFNGNVISAIRFEGDGPRPGENFRKTFLCRVGQPFDQGRLDTAKRFRSASTARS